MICPDIMVFISVSVWLCVFVCILLTIQLFDCFNLKFDCVCSLRKPCNVTFSIKYQNNLVLMVFYKILACLAAILSHRIPITSVTLIVFDLQGSMRRLLNSIMVGYHQITQQWTVLRPVYTCHWSLELGLLLDVSILSILETHERDISWYSYLRIWTLIRPL